MKLINLKQLQDLYTVEGARTVFERLTALILRNSGKNTKSIRVQRGDGGVDSFEGEYGKELIVYQCKYFVGNIEKTQKDQIKDSFKVAINNKNFKIKSWILCIPKNFSEKEEVWFSKWKKEVEGKYNITIDYLGEDFYISELLQERNREVRNHIFKDQYEMILRRVEKALNRLSNKDKFKHDEIFLHKVLEKIDEEFLLQFLNNLTTYARFSKNESTDISKFLYWSQKPSNCFINSKVDEKYREFLENLSQLKSFMALNFFFRDNSMELQDFDYHLYPDLNMDFGSYDKEDSELYDRYYDELSDICEEVEDSFEKFIKKAKKEIY